MKIKYLNLTVQTSTEVSSLNKQGRNLLFAFLMVLFSVSSYGQKVINESVLKSTTALVGNSGNDSNRLNSLLYDIHDSAYFQNGKINYYGNSSPVVLFVDVDQFQNISTSINKLARVELVKIYMKGRSPRTINQEILDNLPSLKYIFFVCSNCSESEMTNFFPARDEVEKDVLIIYNSETPN